MSAVRLFHRDSDSFVVLRRPQVPTPGAAPDEQWSGPVGELTKRSLMRYRQDGFFLINGFWRGATANQKDLRRLNAAWVDLDFRDGLTWQVGAALLIETLVSTQLPPPSVVAASGRGAWCYWLLRSDDGDGYAPRATRQNRDVLSAVLRTLVDTFNSAQPRLGADRNSMDLSRATRVPGSVNGKSVTYVKHIGDGTLYTLADLAARLSITSGRGLSRTLPRSPVSAREPTATTRRAEGKRALAKQRLNDFVAIEQARGGFTAGERNRAAVIHASLLRQSGVHREEDLLRQVRSLAVRCRPPLREVQVRQAVMAATRKDYSWRNVTLADKLRVKVSEAKSLHLRHIRPDYERRSGRRTGRRNAEAVARRNALAEIRASMEATSAVASLRALRCALAQRGIEAALSTISRDIVRLPTHQPERA